jgi:hypothetical protein
MSAPTVKALTVYQPWATLIARGIKHCESRSWQTHHRGLVLIHAAKTRHAWQRDMGKAPLFNRLFRDIEGVNADNLPIGAFVGMVNLHTCKRITQHYDVPPGQTERDLGDYRIGRYVWYLNQALAFHEPIPARGKQGLWTWDYSDQPAWFHELIEARTQLVKDRSMVTDP